MPAINRDDLIAALARIGVDDDEAAANAGREATSQLVDAGLAWSDVIVEQQALATLEQQTTAASSRSSSAATPNHAANNDDALLLIDKLLTRDGLFEGTRDELQAYKDDIAAGEFDASDLAYLNALYARVMKDSGKKSA